MTTREQSHENLKAHKAVNLGSDRSFGLVFTVVFILVGLFPLLDERQPSPWALAIAGVFLILSLIAPKLLRPLNVIWFKFGLLLHAIINPIIMGLLFFATVTPTALIFKMMGKDPLSLKTDHSADSYWIKRSPPGPDPKSMKQQF